MYMTRPSPGQGSCLRVRSAVLIVVALVSLRVTLRAFNSANHQVAASSQSVEIVLTGRFFNGRPRSGETIQLHRPFFLHPDGGPAVSSGLGGPGNTVYRTGPDSTLQCLNFTRNFIAREEECRKLLRKETITQLDRVLANSVLSNTQVPQNRIRAACSAKSAVIVTISWRDYNVCHTLMKMLFVYTLVQRTRVTPQWLNIPPIGIIYVLAQDERDRLRFSPKQDVFHGGLMRALFVRHEVEVMIFSSLDEMIRFQVCHPAAAFVTSLSNRFAFPDKLFGVNAGYSISNVASLARHDTISQPWPISSDALALRSIVYHPKTAPNQSNVLLYVARGPTGRRKWNESSERKFRALLVEVCTEHGTDLRIFKPKKRSTFQSHVEPFADASVIVGFHGAGLALAAFSPPEATLVEIAPDYHTLALFGNLQSSNLRYVNVRLSNGTMDHTAPFEASNLILQDMLHIRNVLIQALTFQRKRKELTL